MADETNRVALSSFTAADVSVDDAGNVVIRNPELAKRLREIATRPTIPAEELAGNGICCGNGNCLSDQLVGLFESLVARTRPR